MPKVERTQDNIFKKCTTEGAFNTLSKVDIELIKTMRDIALLDMSTVRKLSAGKGDWNALFKLGYDVLHTLAEAFVYFDKIKAERHECLFAYLCEKHPELEFDWNFLDTIRIIRNRSIYYGKPATHDNWKSVEFQLNLYINTLKKAIEERLKDH